MLLTVLCLARLRGGRLRRRALLAALALAVTAPAAPLGRSFDEPDADTERCLTEGTLLRKNRQALVGVTAPELRTIECDGRERRVVVKQVDAAEAGTTRFDDGTFELGFTDSYRYERAAYLLDRELEMNMVPVAVLREVGGDKSALIEFIDHAQHQEDSPHTPSPRQRALLGRAKGVMALFDALIYNTDRNVTNLLVDNEDWRLYLIDHSRAFRTHRRLPEDYKGTGTCLPAGLYERLRGLEEKPLIELLRHAISKPQIKAILARRDRLVERIEADREQRGDEAVFCGPLTDPGEAEGASG